MRLKGWEIGNECQVIVKTFWEETMYGKLVAYQYWTSKVEEETDCQME